MRVMIPDLSSVLTSMTPRDSASAKYRARNPRSGTSPPTAHVTMATTATIRPPPIDRPRAVSQITATSAHVSNPPSGAPWMRPPTWAGSTM